MRSHNDSELKLRFGVMAEMLRMLAEAQEAAGEDSSEARKVLSEIADIPWDATITITGITGEEPKAGGQ